MNRHHMPSRLATAEDLSAWDAWDALRKTDDPDEWMAPLRRGGTRAERQMRATFRDRGLMLARRAGRKALRLRAALADGDRP